MFFKRIVLGLALLAGIAGVAQAVVITGSDGSRQAQFVRMGFPQVSNTDSITAFAGGGQTSAVQLASAYNRVTTVASGNDSVKLPSCTSAGAHRSVSANPATPSGNTIGMVMFVTNAAAANSMNVFPQTGESINALSANAAYAMAANKTAGFVCGTNGIWYSILGG